MALYCGWSCAISYVAIVSIKNTFYLVSFLVCYACKSYVALSPGHSYLFSVVREKWDFFSSYSCRTTYLAATKFDYNILPNFLVVQYYGI